MDYDITKLSKLDNLELIQYKQDLDKRRLALLDEATLWNTAYVEAKELLRDRLDDIQFEMLLAEEERQNCDLAPQAALTWLH